MIRIATILFLSLVSSMAIASEMKLEGSCKGVEADGTKVNFTYFSGFNGCHNKSEAAITFAEDTSQTGLFTGTRVIQNGEDKYSFTRTNQKNKPSIWLVFADSTGNTQGVFKRKSATGKISSVTLECEILQYEYEECKR